MCIYTMYIYRKCDLCAFLGVLSYGYPICVLWLSYAPIRTLIRRGSVKSIIRNARSVWPQGVQGVQGAQGV